MALADLNAVFLVGCPRSGTTWLRNMLGTHPRIATPPETYLFASYVAALESEWEQHAARPYLFGLPAGLTREEFEDSVARFVEPTYRRILERKPGADVLLDKTPGHSAHMRRIAGYIPGARFIHIVRDGRDVVASLLRARRTWGADWAPEQAATAAAWWRSHVSAAREQAGGLPVHEVRYEALLGPEGPRLLRDAFAFCGVEVSDEDARAAYARFDVDAGGRRHMREQTEVIFRTEADRHRPPGDGDVGPARAGTWRTELAWHECLAVDRVAGPLLRELGYVEGNWTGAGPIMRAAMGAAGFTLPRLRYRWRILRRAFEVKTFP